MAIHASVVAAILAAVTAAAARAAAAASERPEAEAATREVAAVREARAAQEAMAKPCPRGIEKRAAEATVAAMQGVERTIRRERPREGPEWTPFGGSSSGTLPPG